MDPRVQARLDAQDKLLITMREEVTAMGERVASVDGLPAWRSAVELNVMEMQKLLHTKTGETQAAVDVQEMTMAEHKAKAEELEEKVKEVQEAVEGLERKMTENQTDMGKMLEMKAEETKEAVKVMEELMEGYKEKIEGMEVKEKEAPKEPEAATTKTEDQREAKGDKRRKVEEHVLVDRKGIGSLEKWGGGEGPGKQEFDTWHFEVLNALSDVSNRFPRLLKWLERNPKDVSLADWDEFKEKNGDIEESDMGEPRWQWMADQLYSLMSRKTAGDAQAIVRSLEHSDESDEEDEIGGGLVNPLRGLLAWQRVHREATGWNTAKKRALNSAVHFPTRATSYEEVPRAIEEWTLRRRKFERLERTKLADSTAMGALRMIIPEKLAEKALTVQNTVDSEAELKKYILGQCFENRGGNLGKGPNLNAMEQKDENEDQGGGEELYMAYKGGGKAGGGKGGKSSGAAWFEGLCNFCGVYGHSKARCRKLDGIMQAHRDREAKGEGKGDEKGKGWKGGGWNDGAGKGGGWYDGAGKGGGHKGGQQMYGKGYHGGGWKGGKSGSKGKGKKGLNLSVGELFHTAADDWGIQEEEWPWETYLNSLDCGGCGTADSFECVPCGPAGMTDDCCKATRTSPPRSRVGPDDGSDAETSGPHAQMECEWMKPRRPAPRRRAPMKMLGSLHNRFEFPSLEEASYTEKAMPPRISALENGGEKRIKGKNRWRKMQMDEESFDEMLAPLTIEEEIQELQKDVPLNTLPWKEVGRQYSRVRTVMDSGAAESVGPPEMAPHLKIRPSVGSQRGQHYISASKQRLPNLGQQTLHAVTEDYQSAAMTFQIAEVSRPLSAVGEITDKGNVVVFGPRGGFILNLETRKQTRFGREGGIYVMDLWIESPEGCTQEGRTTTFPRQGS